MDDNLTDEERILLLRSMAEARDGVEPSVEEAGTLINWAQATRVASDALQLILEGRIGVNVEGGKVLLVMREQGFKPVGASEVLARVLGALPGSISVAKLHRHGQDVEAATHAAPSPAEVEQASPS